MADSSQKFIARNRAPRVQIEYDVEVYGAEKKVQLPFVMGVMADLAGNSADPLPAVADRAFLDIDVDNFDSRMKAMKPRVAFSVPNTLTGEGSLAVDLTFEAMADFAPAAIARKVAPLAALLQARTELATLMTYMDGKAGAEALIEQVLGDRSLLAALVAAPAPAETQGALDSLRAQAPAPAAGPDPAAAALAALRALPAAAEAPPDPDRAALAALRATAPGPAAATNETAAALSALRGAAPTADAPPDPAEAALAALRAAVPGPGPEPDGTAEALAALRAAAPIGAPPGTDTAGALAALRAAVPVAPAAPDEGPDALASLRAGAPGVAAAPDATVDALASLRAAAPAAAVSADAGTDVLATLRAAADAGTADAARTGADALAGLDDLLAFAVPTPAAQAAAEDPLAGLDDLLAFPAPDPAAPDAGDDPMAGLDDLLGAEPAAAPGDPLTLDTLVTPDPPADPLAGLDDLLAFEAPPAPSPVPEDPLPVPDGAVSPDPGKAAPEDPLAGLDDLLAFEAPAAPSPVPGDPLAGLDDLLALDAPGAPPPGPADPLAGLDDLLAGGPPVAPPAAVNDPLADLDALLADPKPAAPGTARDPSEGPAFGRLTAPQPAAEALARPVFRLAFLGDFSGRAARGVLETGGALAARRGIRFDVDNAEAVIAGFATDLVLPIGPEGRGIAVPLSDLDSLHPDQLVETVDLFAELKGLRQRLSTPATAARALAEMQAWGGAFRSQAAPSASRSAAASVPADLRLSEFQRLVEGRGAGAAPSPAADLIAQIVGPHVVPAPTPEVQAMRAAVDQAMSAAMRLVLHHPEFQAIEAQWRSLDLLARRIETDARLQIVLYDISAEELGADLSSAADLSQSGLFQLLNGPLTEEGEIGFSAVFGLYTFEETPPHAALLGRMARIAEHVQAPFFAAMSPAFLETPKEDRHPLVARAWEDLRAAPQAAWLGLAAPRVLARIPYGARSEPIDAFDFEEFTMAEGLSGMLWANPVVLVAILLAQAWTEGKGKPVLGQAMSLGGMPYHHATDRHGDQVALPCTERNMTTGKVEQTVTRGLMPVIGIKGRDVVRLGSFQSVAGAEILGRWSGNLPPARAPAPPPALAATHAPPAAASLDDELDALLAGFGDAPAAPAEPGSIDAELAALLEGL